MASAVREPQEPFDLNKWEIELKTISYYEKNRDTINRFIKSVINHVSNKSYPQQILISKKCLVLFENIVEDWKNEFVSNYTQLIFEIIIEENTEYWCTKKELLKIFNYWCQEIDVSNRRNAVKNLPKKYVLKMVENISSYGDYDLQVMIIETIFRLYGESETYALLKELLPELEPLSRSFVRFNEETFENDCRRFLNIINQKYERIFSILCRDIIIEDTVQQALVDDTDELWVNFNMCDKAISWYRKRTDIIEELEISELITMFASELENNSIERNPDEVIITFHLKLNGRLVSSFELDELFRIQAKKVLLVLKRNEATEKLLTEVIPKITNYELRCKGRTDKRTRKCYERIIVPYNEKSDSDCSTGTGDLHQSVSRLYYNPDQKCVESSKEEETKIVQNKVDKLKKSSNVTTRKLRTSEKNERASKQSEESIKRTENVSDKPTITSDIEDEINIVPENLSEIPTCSYIENESFRSTPVASTPKNKEKKGNKKSTKKNVKSKLVSLKNIPKKRTSLGANRKIMLSLKDIPKKDRQTEKIHHKDVEIPSMKKELESFCQMFAQGRSLLEYLNDKKKDKEEKNKTVGGKIEKKSRKEKKIHK